MLDFLLILSIGVGIWQLVAGAEVISPLLISVLWAVHSAVPPTLLLYYSLLNAGFFFRLLCKYAISSSGCSSILPSETALMVRHLLQDTEVFLVCYYAICIIQAMSMGKSRGEI